MLHNKQIFLLIFVAFILSSACSSLNIGNSSNNTNVAQNKNVATTSITPASNSKTNDKNDDKSATSNQTEKQKPVAGKGNVQGVILFDSKSAEGIEVRLCEKFSTILGVECKGKTIETKTDKDGIFVLANAEPQMYEGLTAKVFKTDFYVYPQEGIMNAQTFNVEADKTVFARDINLFKSDLKITNPKAGSKVEVSGLEFKWDAYTSATYYKLSLYPEDASSASSYYGERVESNSFAVDKPLTNGKYRITVEGYNADDKKIVESSSDIKFNVTGGAEPTTK